MYKLYLQYRILYNQSLDLKYNCLKYNIDGNRGIQTCDAYNLKEPVLAFVSHLFKAINWRYFITYNFKAKYLWCSCNLKQSIKRLRSNVSRFLNWNQFSLLEKEGHFWFPKKL